MMYGALGATSLIDHDNRPHSNISTEAATATSYIGIAAGSYPSTPLYTSTSSLLTSQVSPRLIDTTLLCEQNKCDNSWQFLFYAPISPILKKKTAKYRANSLSEPDIFDYIREKLIYFSFVLPQPPYTVLFLYPVITYMICTCNSCTRRAHRFSSVFRCIGKRTPLRHYFAFVPIRRSCWSTTRMW